MMQATRQKSDSTANLASWAGNPRVALVLRIITGAIFIYASIDKMIHPYVFGRAIAGYQILPDWAIGIVAAVLPFLELISGALLIAGVWTFPALIWVGGMLAVFILATLQAYLRGLNIDCGCFSTTGHAGGNPLVTLGRDLLILLVWLGAFLPARKSFFTAKPVR